MGYHTDFSGKLLFTSPLTSEQKFYLNSILGEWCLNHPKWNQPNLRYGVDLKLLDDESGLKWNGAEKTYDMDQIVKLVLRLMKENFPDFGLTGKLIAQGEAIDDRWQLYIENEGKRNRMPSLSSNICVRSIGLMLFKEKVSNDQKEIDINLDNKNFID
jgi:hypothetical protein